MQGAPEDTSEQLLYGDTVPARSQEVGGPQTQGEDAVFGERRENSECQLLTAGNL